MKTPGKIALTIGVTCLMHGCIGMSDAERSEMMRRQAVAEAQAKKEAEQRIAPYVEGQQLLMQFTKEQGCQSPTVQALQQKIEAMREINAKFSMYAYSSRHMYEAMTLRGFHTSTVFEFADTSLKKKCLDLAEQQYRSLIEYYIGTSYTGIRDRARIGLDDVREARRNASGAR